MPGPMTSPGARGRDAITCRLISEMLLLILMLPSLPFILSAPGRRRANNSLTGFMAKAVDNINKENGSNQWQCVYGGVW